MTRDEALAIYQAGPEAVVDALCQLADQVTALQEQIAVLREQIRKLEHQLAQNSQNSSKPPSSDGFHKPAPKSLRPRGERKPGGQPGHTGHTLKMVERPQHVVLHMVSECRHCGNPLTHQPVIELEKRQVFDLPPVNIEVTEHQSPVKRCPNCGKLNQAAFPEHVQAPVQYGPRFSALVVYLTGYQLLPVERICEFFADIFCCAVSGGTLVNIIKTASVHLEEPVAQIRQQITAANVAHFDETGCSVIGKLHWLHIASTLSLTYYHVHKKRGQQAMDDIDILPNFHGRAVHDCWGAYSSYDCLHALCNAHLLRELVFILEVVCQSWASAMIDCLLDAKLAVEQAKLLGYTSLPGSHIEKIETSYRKAIDLGVSQNPLPAALPSGKTGRPKKTKAQNLIKRLKNHQDKVLAFIRDFSVPFDNNLVERDGRMMKVKLKISGTFRSYAGAEDFCRIRSYISTARKNAVNVFAAIGNIFTGNPFQPPAPTPSDA